jgi:curved DNA-binding protein CbpA
MLRESHPMSDHFAALQQPRRPWLEAETLKECFHRASAEWHPDVAGSGDAARFAAASAAYSVLRDPGSRLRHLLELEAPEQFARPQVIPPELADLFMRLAEFRQVLDTFQKKERAAAPGLARALLAADRQALFRRANALHADLEAAHALALAQLRVLDADWVSRAADAAERLAALLQHFAYLSKWRAQLGESLFQLQS